MTGKFKVVAIHTRDGIVERREVEQFDSVAEAFTRFGTLAAASNGVIVLDEHGGLWAKHEPSQIEKVSAFDAMRYQLFRDPDYADYRMREKADG